MYQLKKVYLEITNVCNLRCDFCPGTRRPQGFLSPEDFSVLAQKLRPHTEYLYLHLMGEPLLHPQLPRLLDLAAGLGFQVNLTTNGTLLPQRAGLLCQSPAVRKVSISLHSFEGNEGQGQLLPYLDSCIAFARRAAQAGKRCALRLWNLDGEHTQGPTPATNGSSAGWRRPSPGPGRRAGRAPPWPPGSIWSGVSGLNGPI